MRIALVIILVIVVLLLAAFMLDCRTRRHTSGSSPHDVAGGMRWVRGSAESGGAGWGSGGDSGGSSPRP
jgi:hypothetical protein